MNEKEYQYSKESLLENPQTYQFTKFEGKEFLQRYVNSRKKIILKLGSSRYSDADIEKVIEQEQNDSRKKNNTTIFELRRILLHIINNNKDTKINAKFEMYLKKFEINKRLYDKYDDNEKNSTRYDIIENYILLSVISILKFKKTENLKFLNTALKLNDTICSEFRNMIKEDYNKLFKFSLESEMSIITRFMKKIGAQ